MPEKSDNKRQRPNQVVFYGTDETLEVLKEEANRSDYINKAIAVYSEYKEKGAMWFSLEKAYDYMSLSPSPEADAVRKALRQILWRRNDLPTSVWASIRLSNGTRSSEAFSNVRAAMLLSMENPDCEGFQIFNATNEMLADAFRTNTGSFAFNHLSPEAMVN